MLELLSPDERHAVLEVLATLVDFLHGQSRARGERNATESSINMTP
jgi:hypothetical protein